MNDIRLLDLEISDIELVRNWRNSEEVSAYMYTSGQITREQQEEWFKKISQQNDSKYWIVEFQGSKIGLVSITGINYVLSSCFWAFYLGDTTIRGAGIGGKIEYNLLEYVFNDLNLNKLRCEVFVTNEKVIRMHEKFGFRREAYYREHCVKENRKLDVVGLAILKSEWQQLRTSIYNKIYDPENI